MKKAVNFSLIALVAMQAGIFADTNQDNGTVQDIFYPGQNLQDNTYPAAYNASASVRLKNKDGELQNDQIFIKAGFNYLDVYQGGMDLATSGYLYGPVNNDTKVGYLQQSKVLYQDTKYNPCFDVVVGFQSPEWQFGLGYDWIRSNTYTNQQALGVEDPSTGIGVWTPNNWFYQETGASQEIAGTDISSKWHVGLDLFDLFVSRPFYEGKRVVVSPYGAISAAWIRQKLITKLTIQPDTVIAQLENDRIASRNYSNSWSLGPKIGVKPKVLLGRNFWIDMDAAAALLFTQYTTIKHSESLAQASSIPSQIGTIITNYDTLTPELELALNLGWGDYFHDQKYYMDFSIGYRFIEFFEQNRMRSLVDQTLTGSGAAPSNLFIHGLNVSLDLHF